jgi:hypothetical protein
VTSSLVKSFLFFVLMVCFFESFAEAQSSPIHNPFRGYAKINQILHERVAVENGFQLGQYLDKVSIIPASGDLLSLLGTYDGSDTNSTYRNADPNSINMLLWYIALDELSTDIASNCSGNSSAPLPGAVQPLVLLPAFQAALKPLCFWPAAQAKTDDVLYAFWSSLLGYDAPPEEFLAWKNYFLSESAYDEAPITTVISDMGLAALYNPYFLLEP